MKVKLKKIQGMQFSCSYLKYELLKKLNKLFLSVVSQSVRCTTYLLLQDSHFRQLHEILPVRRDTSKRHNLLIRYSPADEETDNNDDDNVKEVRKK